MAQERIDELETAPTSLGGVPVTLHGCVHEAQNRAHEPPRRADVRGGAEMKLVTTALTSGRHTDELRGRHSEARP